MSPDDTVHDRAEGAEGSEDGEERPREGSAQKEWTPPESSDQAPGEEVVQVNDAYTGAGAPPPEESHRDDDQHPTGG